MRNGRHPNARTYTPEQRNRALELVPDVGIAAAARELGINIQTVATWAHRAGISAATVPLERRVGRAATYMPSIEGRASRLARQQELREQVKEMFLRRAYDALKWAAGDKVETGGRPTRKRVAAGDMRNYILAAGIAIEKYRLEVGESSTRQELTVNSYVERVAAELGLDPAEIMREAQQIMAEHTPKADDSSTNA